MPFEVHFGCWGWPWTSCDMLEALGDAKGLDPGLTRGRQNGLDCTPVGAGALFYWDPGIQGTATVEGGFGFLGPTINLTSA